MKPRAKAHEYAKSLSIISDHKLEDGVKYFKALSHIMTSSKELGLFLGHPAISVQEKLNVLTKLAHMHASDTTKSVLETLVRRGDIKIVPLLVSELELLDQLNAKRYDICVLTARELDHSQVHLLTEKLTKAMGKKVVIHPKIDARLMAGIVIQYGDFTIDTSIKSKMAALTDSLSAVASE